MTNRLTTGSVPEPQRLDYWQTVCGEMIGTFELRDCNPDDFDASIDVSVVGDLTIGHFQGVSQTLDRKKSLIKTSDTDDYIVLLESDNTFKLDHCGHQHSGRGGIVFVDITQPFNSNHPERLDVVDIIIPRKKLEAVLGSARLAAGLSIDGTQASFPILMAFLRSLSDHGAALEPATAKRMSTIAIDLIAAGFAERMEQSAPRHFSGASTLYRAQAYIADNLGKSGLGMQEIAAAANVSVRRLHQIAVEEGTSLMDWMWERRLARALAMLEDPVNRALPVGTIAFRCGFLDQAHFSRRFKERFGCTPTECRANSHEVRRQAS